MVGLGVVVDGGEGVVEGGGIGAAKGVEEEVGLKAFLLGRGHAFECAGVAEGTCTMG